MQVVGVRLMTQAASELIRNFEKLTSQREKVVKELAVLEAEQDKAKAEAAKIVESLKARNIDNFEMLQKVIEEQRASLNTALESVKKDLVEVGL